jgi:hypothetical protein
MSQPPFDQQLHTLPLWGMQLDCRAKCGRCGLGMVLDSAALAALAACWCCASDLQAFADFALSSTAHTHYTQFRQLVHGATEESELFCNCFLALVP